MHKKIVLNLIPAILILSTLIAPVTMAQTSISQNSEETVVHAVLFFSPTCGHCHNVIQNTLLPMIEEYGNQLQILGIDTSQPEGSVLYQNFLDQFEVPGNRRGVPALVVADTVLVGSGEIPDQFPGIVTEALAGEGIPWPNIEGLNPDDIPEPEAETATEAEAEAGAASEAKTQSETEIEAEPATAEESASPTEPDSQPEAESVSAITDMPLTFADASAEGAAVAPDSNGMTIAWVIMILMIITLAFAAWRIAGYWHDLVYLFQTKESIAQTLNMWLVPLLTVAGLVVASYLAYVELTHVEAVCGPVGDCNAVQTSSYASIFGIPIAVLGILNYVAIAILWIAPKFIPTQLGNWAILALVPITVFGVLFSIYLTYLEIFIIKAVCMWCISSAIITTILMLISLITTTSVLEPAEEDITIEANAQA